MLVAGQGPQQVQLYLLGGGGEGEPGVVVGQQGLVVVRLGPLHHAPDPVLHDRLPHRAALVDGDPAPAVNACTDTAATLTGSGRENREISFSSRKTRMTREET